MRKVLAILAGIALGFAFVAAALADVGVSGSDPPEAYVKAKGNVVQHMATHEFFWRYESEDGGWASTADRAPGDPEPPYTFPKAKRVAAGRVNFITYNRDKPERFTIRTKDGKAVPSHLYPFKGKKGKVAGGGAYFYHHGHHRYVLSAKWERIPGKDFSHGRATYLAHLKAY